MPIQEVMSDEEQLDSDFTQQQEFPADHFHHLLLQLCKGELNSWTDLKIAHRDLDSPVVQLSDRLSWSPFDTNGAPGTDELYRKSKRFVTLGRILLDQIPTRSFWVLHEIKDKSYVGIWHDGWINNMLEYLYNLEMKWKNGGDDWSVNVGIGKIPDDLIHSLEEEVVPEDQRPKPDYIELKDPITPPRTPSDLSYDNFRLLSREEYDSMPSEEQGNYSQRIEQEKRQIEGELGILNQNSYTEQVQNGCGQGKELTSVNLAESFLARHLSPNMLSYLHSIPRDTAENCKIADQALDEVVAKKFKTLQF